MTDKELQKLIDYLNSDQNTKIIHKRSLTNNVEIANIWEEKPHDNSKFYGGKGFNTYYLIKNKDNKYGGVIYDMGDNLHWYLSEEWRGQGIMTKVLKNVVLPHQLSIKPKVEITINSSAEFEQKSINVAIQSGLKKRDGKYRISRRFKNYVISYFFPTEKMKDERSHEIYHEIGILLKRIEFLESEAEMYKFDSEVKRSFNLSRKNLVKLKNLF